MIPTLTRLLIALGGILFCAVCFGVVFRLSFIEAMTLANSAMIASALATTRGFDK